MGGVGVCVIAARVPARRPAHADVEAIHGFVAVFEHASAEQRAGLFGAVVDDPAAGGFERVLALSGRDAARPLRVSA